MWGMTTDLADASGLFAPLIVLGAIAVGGVLLTPDLALTPAEEDLPYLTGATQLNDLQNF